MPRLRPTVARHVCCAAGLVRRAGRHHLGSHVAAGSQRRHGATEARRRDRREGQESLTHGRGRQQHLARAGATGASIHQREPGGSRAHGRLGDARDKRGYGRYGLLGTFRSRRPTLRDARDDRVPAGPGRQLRTQRKGTDRHVQQHRHRRLRPRGGARTRTRASSRAAAAIRARSSPTASSRRSRRPARSR